MRHTRLRYVIIPLKLYLKKIGSASRLLTCFRSKGFYKDQPCSVKNVGHLLYHSHLMSFLCVTQSLTIDRTTVARNGSMDIF